MTKATLKEQGQARLLDEWIAGLTGWSDHMKEYERKTAERMVRLDNGGVVCISKPSIETEFCFGYDTFPGNDDERASDEMQSARNDGGEYFKEQNLKRLNTIIEELEDDHYTWYSHRQFYDCAPNVKSVFSCRRYETPRDSDTPEPITENDRANLLEAYKKVRADFEKRLDTYLRKYGTSKLHMWTYWRDE